jgi:hypothetical protein
MFVKNTLIADMGPPASVELDAASLQHIFSFLSPNDLVLSVKPLNKHFRAHVSFVLQGKANKVAASDNLPSWALPSLELTSLTCGQKKQLMAAAAKGGRLQTLLWAREQGCPWDCSISEAAAASGHLDVLQWLRQEGCPWGASAHEAAKGGHLEILQWTLQDGCPGSRDVCSAAAATGRLELLQCARSNGCPWDASTCAAAARNGNLLMLQWARADGCPWDSSVCTAAAIGGHL